MICQATYDSLDAIPEALRDEFEQVNAKWQLKASAIPGVGPLFNSALAANERKAVDQVKTRNEKIRLLEEEKNNLEDKLATLDVPGHKVLSKEDSELWDKYNALGTPKEIEGKLEQLPTLQQKVAKAESAEMVAKIATAGGVNTEVLSDWASNATGLTFFTKSVEQTDAKGVKTTVEVPYVKVETIDGGKTKVEEKELLPFAKETLPEWKYTALTTVNGDAASSSSHGNTAPRQVAGVQLPSLGSATTKPAGDKKERAVDKANKERAAKPNPFMTPPNLVGTGGGQATAATALGKLL